MIVAQTAAAAAAAAAAATLHQLHPMQRHIVDVACPI